MEDSPTTKPTPTNVSRTADLMKKGLFFYPHFCPFGTRRSMALVYCFFTFAFVTCTTILFFNNPSNTHSSLWFSNILNTRSHFSSIFSHFFPNPNTSTTTSHSSPSPSPSSYPPHDVFIHKSPFFPETNASFNGTNQLLPSPAYKTNNTSQHHHVMGLNGTTKESVKNIPVDSSKNATGEKEMNMMPNRTDLFKKHSDGGAKVEFFRSTFLVQEWEMPDTNGSTKETLRLDLIERSSDRYKNADILVFNTGHWWTHEKTSQGKGYYQEGSHVYGLLDVVEAFRKAMTTWARWIDANVNPTKTLVSFRGYSASHFSGGQWNSGGQCDNETEPIKNEAYLSENLQIMSMLEQVIKGMKTSVFYLNVTKMTDFRKDAHPSIYRKQNLTKEERRSPLRFQDCSHWCLPGVPDTWNELLYSQIFIKYNQKEQQQQQK
ncbi:hypothetical protein TEA_001623 [Camellia sinensis var. sinensis]|uniref:Trichome birefringence-like C-terminal domain-containing protein n=1 Tax=Camellia sinensis var. sinensis TaxID=542762 RepID=A0A4S4D2X8_CAMSN|nr:hypothetical protein TEA_001623 [Camellia sinensis var. sinensis]